MTIDQADLINELESLERQRAEHLSALENIHGAEQMVRHLLAKAQARHEQGHEQTPGALSARVNGEIPAAAGD